MTKKEIQEKKDWIKRRQVRIMADLLNSISNTKVKRLIKEEITI